MLEKKQGKQRLEPVSDYVVFDVETTGISCRYDEVVELSALKVKDGKGVEMEAYSIEDNGKGKEIHV